MVFVLTANFGFIANSSVLKQLIPSLNMDIDSQLEETLQTTVLHAVSRMESLEDRLDRRSIFNEYREWLEVPRCVDIWALPSNWDSY